MLILIVGSKPFKPLHSDKAVNSSDVACVLYSFVITIKVTNRYDIADYMPHERENCMSR